MLSIDSWGDKIHLRMKLRLLLYFVLAIAILSVSLFHIIRDNANVLYSCLGLIAGGLIGVVLSRMYKIFWDEQTTQVISKYDAFGISIFIVYIMFELSREEIVARFVNGPSVVAVSFAVWGGVMIGRILGIRRKIKGIFKQEGVV